MGQARKASAKRSKRGDARRGGRGPVAAAAAGVAAAQQISAGEPVDEGEADQSLGNSSLAKRYRGLRLKAEAALELLISTPGVPANVRAAAVRTALELVGAIGAKAKGQRDQEDNGDDLDPETLSIEDIDRAIQELGRV